MNTQDTEKTHDIIATWFPEQVLSWAQTHGRHDFPWQAPHSPYKTWVSEIMLQQTQAQRVVSFFTQFMHTFPDVKSLAEAQEDKVFHLWSGLGYYTRAQNLVKAARVIMDKLDGVIPSSLEQLLLLPGIGRSTAGAIRSLGHGLDGEILDGNVRRVIGRFFLVDGKPQSKKMENTYWDHVKCVTPHKPLADRAFNQAMMDLGATVCTIRSPRCSACPLQTQCLAFQQNKTDAYPVTVSKYKKLNPETVRQRRIETKYYLCLIKDGELMLQKRPPTGIWRNLWSPLEFGSYKELENHVEDQLSITYKANSKTSRSEKKLDIQPLTPLFHQFSHFDLHFVPYRVQIGAQDKSIYHGEMHEPHRFLWYNIAEPQDIGLASPVLKLINQLEQV